MSTSPATDAPHAAPDDDAGPVAPEVSRSRASIRAWSASLGFTVVTMVTGLVATPILVRALGDERIGLFRALTEGVSYLTLLGQGISVALVPAVAAAMAVRDRARLNRMLAASLRIYLGATAIALAVGLILLPFVPRLLKVGPGLMAETRWAWLITLASVALMALSPMRIVLDVAHRAYQANLLMIAQALVTTALNVSLAVWTDLGVVGVVLGTLAGGLVYNIGMLALVGMLMPGLLADSVRTWPGEDEWRSARSTSGPTLLALLSERISVLSDSLVLSAVLGPSAAAVLFLTQRLASLGHATVGSIAQAVWPGLTEIYHRDDVDLFNRRLVETARVLTILAVAGLVPIAAYNHHFVALWVGPDLDGGPAVAVVAALNALLMSLTSLFSVVLVTTGEIRRLVAPSMVAAAINLAVSVAASRAFGPVGPVLGTLVATTCVPLWYLPRLLRRKFGTPPGRLAMAVAAPLSMGVVAGALLWAWAHWHQPAGWLGLLAEMALAASVLLVNGYFAFLTAEERDLWHHRLVKPLLGRFRRDP